MNIEGGFALPVHKVTDNLVVGGPAIPVAVVTGRQAYGQPARRVKVITSADLIQNGGKYWLDGRIEALPVVSDASGNDEGNPAIAVYVVSGILP